MRANVEIEDLAPGGEGVGHHGARAVFVPFAAPGDVAEVDLPGGEGPAHATLVRVVSAGAARAAAPCAHFGLGDACGGCEWQHVAYDRQLAAKERTLLETLRKVGRIEPAEGVVRPIVPSPAPFRYRSRAKFHFDRDAGRLVFFRRRSHQPVLLRECHLLVPELDALREAMGPALGRARLSPREVSLEWSAREGRGSAYLVLAEVTPALRARAEALVADVASLSGAVVWTSRRSPSAEAEA